MLLTGFLTRFLTGFLHVPLCVTLYVPGFCATLQVLYNVISRG